MGEATDPNGGITRYTYDAQHRMLTLTDPLGITFLTNEYDPSGRVVRQTQADSGVWTFGYTTTGGFVSQTTVTDPRGNGSTYRFNSSGYLIEQVDALGQKTTFTRQPGTNLLLATTDPLGRVTRFEYDGSGNVTKITDPQGNVRTFTYDPTFHKVTSSTDPLGNVSRFTYDGFGNLIATTDPLGHETRITYNEAGQPSAMTDPLGNTTRFTYDSTGNLANTSDPVGNTTQRSYDTVSRLIAQTDPLGRTKRFTYDSLNRLMSIVDPLGGTTTFTYDLNGNPLTVTDPRGNTITHEYDIMDRLSRRVDPLGAADTLQYDLAGNLIEAVDRKGQATRSTYDALNRRIATTSADQSTATFTYDAASRLVTSADSAGGTIAWTYDALDRLTSETSPQGSVASTYDGAGRRTTMTMAGDSPIQYTWDAAHRLLSISQDTLTASYTYDGANRRSTRTLPNGLTMQYTYDPAARLVGLAYGGPGGPLGEVTVSYDPAGNRIGAGGSFARTLLPGAIPSATYDPANRQLAFGSQTLTYDANGNLTAIRDGGGTTTHTWDARDRLIAVTGPGFAGNFTYDGTGRRLQKTINGVTTTFLHDGREVIREMRGGVEVDYLRGLGLDEPVAAIANGEVTSFLPDALGSTLALTDGAGSLVTTYTYDPFGTTATAGSASDNPLQFTGREHDGGGLYFYRMRYYRPALARFLSEDPLGPGGGLNLYTYVGNAPTQFVDPFGLRCLSPEEGQKIVEKAKEWEGLKVPYKDIGDRSSRDGADCSGAVKRIYEEAGNPYDPYRRTEDFAKPNTRESRTNPPFREVTTPQPGDIALFPGHMGIYDPNGPPHPTLAGKQTILSARGGRTRRFAYGLSSFFGGNPRYFRYDTPDDRGANCP